MNSDNILNILWQNQLINYSKLTGRVTIELFISCLTYWYARHLSESHASLRIAIVSLSPGELSLATGILRRKNETVVANLIPIHSNAPLYRANERIIINHLATNYPG